MSNGNGHDTHAETNGRLVAAQPSGGPSVDKQGDAVVDPTRNVLDLVKAGNERQDDLRELEGRWRDKLDAERADYDEKLREAEAKRIDAIRAVDVAASQQGRTEAEARATALAAQVAASAEAMRNQVAAAASAAQTSLTAALEPIQKDIIDLRRFQYEGVGQKTQVAETTAKSNNSINTVTAVFLGFSVIMSLVGIITAIILHG